MKMFKLRELVISVEITSIEYALALTEGNISRAAVILGFERSTLHMKMKKYGITRPASYSTGSFLRERLVEIIQQRIQAC